jgi:hypothetical protein
MTTESIAIPAERVPPVARDMASSSKSIAGVLFFLGAIVAIGALGALGEGTHDDDRPKNSAEAAGNAVGAVLGAGIIFGVPGWFGFRAARNASRATRAASVAKTDPSYTWRLAGKYIIAADGHGAPHPELSFKINGKLRTMLLALPRANVVSSS